MPGAQRLFLPWPRTPLGRQILLKDIFRALRQKPCLLFGSSLRTFSSGNWTRGVWGQRGGALKDVPDQPRAHTTSVLPLEPHTRWASSARPRPAATTSWGREPCDRHLPPRRACGVQLAERLRAARTQTEPREVEREPQALRFLVRVDLSKSTKYFPALKPQPAPAARARVSAESAAEKWLVGIPGGARAWQPGSGRRGELRPPSLPSFPEVDLIPASFAGAQQHRRGGARALQLPADRPPFKEKQIK